ncbi:MAG: sulfatase [Verrucomicrobia bacterium]|nr:sulfatase [Verrucomicrobiota bacterium]
MKPLACLALFLFVLCPALNAADKPNILFIAIDDQNDWIGHLGGHPMAKTPNIDKLAARGTTFLNAHCNMPLCNPSRTSLLLGLRPTTTGIYGLSPWFRTLPQWKDRVALPQHFENNGYLTAATGKIYHGGTGGGGGGGKGKNAAKKTPAAQPEFMRTAPLGGVGTKPPQKLTPPAPMGNHPAMDWGVWPKDKKILENDRQDTPRFSWYIHWELPEPRLKWIKENNQWRNLVRSYLACTSFVDSQIGRLMTALDEAGVADNTIVVLWGDHGWHLGEKEITGKNTLWDRGTKVPLIFAGPGVKGGQRCLQPAELLDIYPTLIDLAGLPKRDDLEGLSLIPQLTNAATKRERPAITSHNQGNHGIRSENWRYIHYADGSEELYDMVNDPNEWHNVAAKPENAAIIAEHKKWLPKIDVPPAPNSASRVLTYDKATDEAVWEGKTVKRGDPIPQ